MSLALTWSATSRHLADIALMELRHGMTSAQLPSPMVGDKMFASKHMRQMELGIPLEWLSCSPQYKPSSCSAMLPYECSASTVRVQCECSASTVRVQCECSASAVRVQCECSTSAVRVQCECSCNRGCCTCTGGSCGCHGCGCSSCHSGGGGRDRSTCPPSLSSKQARATCVFFLGSGRPQSRNMHQP
jgi:hypothetical protein